MKVDNCAIKMKYQLNSDRDWLAIIRIWKFKSRFDFKRFLLCCTRKLFSNCVMNASPIYMSFETIMGIPSFKIILDFFQLLQCCLKRHIFFNALPKCINVNKYDI